jgi:transposase InsO family protein
MTGCGKVGVAGARAGMSRNTAAKYLGTDKLPSELRVPRTWRTRQDPFAEAWPGILARLQEQPGLWAKTLFEELTTGSPGSYEDGQLRTLQRRFKQWRAQEGPDKELFLPQEHRPGEAMQTDFTEMNSLAITIAGEPYEHLLCHSGLPCSNWSWGTPCRSESLPALKQGVQAALLRLGYVPEYHQTDNSTAATHRLETGKRAFNQAYLEFMAHYGMKPRTIAVGKKEQNGDVESLNGALKRELEQQLLLRGSRDFLDHEQYVNWLHGVMEARNRARGARFDEELAAMRPLLVAPVPEYTEVDVRVGSGGTIRVKGNTYSVPSRLRDEKVRARVFDDRLEVFHGDQCQLTVERLRGKRGHRVNYRHVVGSLLRKPGAFRCYRYRDDLFPTPVFRAACEALQAMLPEYLADLEYLRVLELAATTLETDVEAALQELMAKGVLPRAESVRDLVAPRQTSLPELQVTPVDLTSYDGLLVECWTEVPA